MAINPSRHLDVFSPVEFGDRRVDVIGVGATGSKVTLELAKLGIKNIHVWDFDKVEKHNIANQLYRVSDIGKLKGKALSDIVKEATETKIVFHNEKADGTQSFGDIVFLLTDSIDSRKQIFEGSLKFKVTTRLIIETRMGADNGRVYSFNPSKPSHIEQWSSTLRPVKVKTTACGAATTVGATAAMIASLAVWQLIRWFAVEKGGKDKLENEIIFGLRPPVLMSRVFE